MPWCVMDFPSREARQFYGRGCRAFTTADTAAGVFFCL